MARGSSSLGEERPAGPRIAAYVDLDLVGDALIKLPFVRALRAAWPTAEITWIAGRGRSAYAGALTPLMPGLLDRVIEECGTDAALRSALGPPRLDVLIDTQSRVATALALRRLGPRRFVSAAAAGWLNSRPRPLWRKPRRLIRRLLDLAAFASGAPARPDGALTLPPAAIAMAASLLPAGPAYIAQVIGAGERHKAWPPDRHIALAHALLGAGRVPVLILGPAEADLVAPLRAAVPEARTPLQDARLQATGAFDPALTIALAARCVAAVAADCGGGHMMAAAGIKLVSLFGPTDPAKFAPWTQRGTVLRAQDFGGIETGAIPAEAVLAALAPAA